MQQQQPRQRQIRHEAEKEEDAAAAVIIDPILDIQIDEITAYMSKCYGKNLRTSLSIENLKTVVKYVMALKTEINLSPNYRRDIIDLLTRFGRWLRYSFKDATRDDIISFLDSFRKSESVDPLHGWISTYNTYRIHLIKFFKWYYASDIEPSKRPHYPVAPSDV